MKKNLWSTNQIQFPRLIAELDSAGLLDKDTRKRVADKMEVSVGDVADLIDRAGQQWDRIVHSPLGRKHHVV